MVPCFGRVVTAVVSGGSLVQAAFVLNCSSPPAVAGLRELCSAVTAPICALLCTPASEAIGAAKMALMALEKSSSASAEDSIVGRDGKDVVGKLSIARQPGLLKSCRAGKRQKIEHPSNHCAPTVRLSHRRERDTALRRLLLFHIRQKRNPAELRMV